MCCAKLLIQEGFVLIIIQMSKAFKKKKDDPVSTLTSKLDFLLGPQVSNNQQATLNRNLIIKCAMFWDSKSRVQRIKSLVLSSMSLQTFEDSEDFSISELTSIELLSLSKNKIIHLQPLSVLQTLITLNISHNKVYDLSPLQTLVNLQQLYASNNEISNVEPLQFLINLRVLNLYKNKVKSFDGVYTTLQKLTQLQDLDVQENAFFNQDVRQILISLPISRLNDRVISKAQKNTMRSSSISMSSSLVMNPLSLSMMRDTNTSFFNHSSKSKGNKVKQLKNKLESLEEEYSKVDDMFEQQIVKNVMLKSEYHRKLMSIKQRQNQKEENEYKAQQIKLMKRKVKDLKEILFKNEQKGHLLRKLFELQVQSIPKKEEKKEIKREIDWVRKFDCDDTIVISDDNKYLVQDRELAELLDSNSNTLQELRRQLQYLT